MAIFTSEGSKSYKDLSADTEYCYINYLNDARIFGGKKSNAIMKFFKGLITINNTTLFKKQDKDFLNTVCDKDGKRLLDYAIEAGNANMVQFLLDDCEVSINTIPFRTGKTAIYKVLNDFDFNSPQILKIVDYAKIVGMIIRYGGHAYKLGVYEYDVHECKANDLSPIEKVAENMIESSITSVNAFISKCVNYLGYNVDIDDKLISAIDVFARMGFFPPVSIYSHKNYLKYHLDEMFDFENRECKLSCELAESMLEFMEVYSKLYDINEKSYVEDANVTAYTYSTYLVNKKTNKIDMVDYSNNMEGEIVNSIDDEYTDSEICEFCDGGVIEAEFGYEKQHDEDEELVFGASVDISEAELDELDEKELIEDDGEIDPDLDRIGEIIPKYEVYELNEIRNMNEEYLLDSPSLITLFESPQEMKEFDYLCDKAVLYNSLGMIADARIIYLEKMRAKRLSNKVDDMLDIQPTTNVIIVDESYK